MVKGGFSLRIAELTLYGVRDGDRLQSLAVEQTWTPKLSTAKAERLAAFLERNGLMLVHWYSANVIEGKFALSGYFTQQTKPK